MTLVQTLIIVVLVCLMLVGLWLTYKAVRQRFASNEDKTPQLKDKNGIPIIPRHERELVDEPDLDDTLAGETTIIPNRQHLKAVMVEDDTTPTNQPIHQPTHQQSTKFDDVPNLEDTAYQMGTEYVFTDEDTQDDATDAKTTDIDINTHTTDAEPDLFSSLASATENLMPAVNSAEEPQFEQNSPVVDGYLNAMTEQDQNSPIKYAKDTLEVLLMPQNNFERISGEKILKLVETFGMRHSVMNLFHRYENKDGTGILWFSMIGIDPKEGMTPFHLTTLPQREFQGIALFLSLPHPTALQGFDSMISIATLMATELNACLMDKDEVPLNKEHKLQLRNYVQEYMQSYREKS